MRLLLALIVSLGFGDDGRAEAPRVTVTDAVWSPLLRIWGESLWQVETQSFPGPHGATQRDWESAALAFRDSQLVVCRSASECSEEQLWRQRLSDHGVTFVEIRDGARSHPSMGERDVMNRVQVAVATALPTLRSELDQRRVERVKKMQRRSASPDLVGGASF